MRSIVVIIIMSRVLHIGKGMSMLLRIDMPLHMCINGGYETRPDHAHDPGMPPMWLHLAPEGH